MKGFFAFLDSFLFFVKIMIAFRVISTVKCGQKQLLIKIIGGFDGFVEKNC